MDSRYSASMRADRREGSRFEKFRNSDNPADFGDYEQSWNYTPRSRGHDEQNVRSPWHLPPNNDEPRDLRDRSRSLGRTQSESDRRSVTSISRQNREDNGYSSDRKRSRHEDDEKNLPHKEFLNLPNHNLKPLKEIPEFEVDLPLREGMVDSSDLKEGIVSDTWIPQVMIIMDKAFPELPLTKSKVKYLTKRLTKRFLKAIDKGIGVQFESQIAEGKYMKFTCANEDTCHWLKSAISNLGPLWEGAKMVVVKEDELKSYVRFTTFLSGIKQFTQEICEIALVAQNPQFCIDKWVIEEFIQNDNAGGYNVTFSVPDEFIPEIEAAKNKAYFMFSTIRLSRKISITERKSKMIEN